MTGTLGSSFAWFRLGVLLLPVAGLAACQLASDTISLKTEKTAGLSVVPSPRPALLARAETENRARSIVPNAPMIIFTAALTIVAKEYGSARPALDRILATHGGFAAQLSATDTKGEAQTLTATLHVPSDKLSAVVNELKKLGRVESETQKGDEVTQQYTDLTARLSNARNTEQRLIAVLRERTGKVKDILEVEQEIARVREEIETMDAERRTMENRVQFATIQLQVREDYKAALEVAPPTTGTRLWNALVAGIRDAAESFLALILFALNAGPTLLLWAAILFWPARLAWRHFRPQFAVTRASSP